jgi:eukaryotic-like serine/threonine-protein kinase
VFCEATVRMCEARLGPRDRQTITSRNNLAIALNSAGRTGEALVEFAAAHRLSEASFGPDHAKTLAIRNNLAVVLANAGRAAEAIALNAATLEVRESRFGPDHPMTIKSRGNLAHSYWKAGRLDVSIPLFELNLQQSIAKLGPDHPDTLRVQANLGVNYRDAGRAADGARLMEEALRRASGRPELMVTLRWLKSSLAAAYEACGQFARAEPLYRQELATARDWSGATDQHRLDTMRSLGLNLAKQKKLTEAEPVFRESLALGEKSKPDDWFTFSDRWVLGMTLVRLGRDSEAEVLLVRGYDGMRARESRVPSMARANVTEAVKGLIRFYEQRNRPREAATWRARIGLPDPDAAMPTGIEAFAPTTNQAKEEPSSRQSKP